MRSVRTIAFPPESRLFARLGEATYHDAYEADLDDPGLNATEIARRAFRSTPEWVEALLALRNRIVAPLGVMAVGRLGDEIDGAAEPGERFSIFQVEVADRDELVLGIDDSHLDVRISFLKRKAAGTYVIASWVKTHNALGRVYMLPVGRVHKAIVRLMMRGLEI